MMTKSKRGSKSLASPEMLIPFSLDETLDIIESLEDQNRRLRQFRVTVHEHDGDLVVFQVHLEVSDIYGMGRFDCFGELRGDHTYNTTMLQWLPSENYRRSDFFAILPFFVWVVFAITISPHTTPLDFMLPLGFLIFAFLFVPIDRRARRNKRRKYIRKKVETRLLEAMDANR